MPTINTATSTPSAEFSDIGAFLALAQDPKAFGEKLAQLKQATADLNQARDENDESRRQLVGADEVYALLEKTRENNALAEQALGDANLKATNIVAAANAEAVEILKKANADADAIVAKAQKKFDEATQAVSDGLAKQNALDAQLAKAIEREQEAQQKIDLAMESSGRAEDAQKFADNYLLKIQGAFAQFIKAVQ